MARVSNHGGYAGLRIPGIYQDLVERERDRCERYDDPRWGARHPGEKTPPRYRRSRRLLDALEASETVLVPRWMVGARRIGPLPCDFQAVTVSPHDIVNVAEGPAPYPGEAVHATTGVAHD